MSEAGGRGSGPPTVEEVLAEVERRRAGRAVASPPGAADRLLLWLARHWLALVNLAALLYMGLPFAAPILMRAGLPLPAQIIYAMYRPLCHQLPYRSWYLFGEQLAYTYDQLAANVGEEALVPHGYVGDPELGYKVALCQRDTAIYGSILLAGLAYAMSRRWSPLPFWAYIVFGVVPIGLDGGLQLVTYLLAYVLPDLAVTPLESSPLRRVITGTLFGVATVWLVYPRLQEVAAEIVEKAGVRQRAAVTESKGA